MSLKHTLQRMVMAMPPSLQGVLEPGIRVYAEWDQTRRLNRAVHKAAKLITLHKAPAAKGIFIDCGFNNGLVLQKFIQAVPDNFDYYGFEVQGDLLEQAQSRIEESCPSKKVILTNAGVSDNDLDIIYYPSRVTPWGILPRIATTTETGREVGAHMDYSSPRKVCGIDFSKWLSEKFEEESAQSGGRPFVAVKMNIEGAEYPVLDKVLADGNFSKISVLIAEFHHAQFFGDKRAEFERSYRRIARAIKEYDIPYMAWA